MHICVIGAGSIGMFLAARLAIQNSVILVDRHARERSLCQIKIVGKFETAQDVVVTPYVEPAEIILVTTKAMDLVNVCRGLQQVGSTPIIFFQNGLGVNTLVRDLLPSRHVARGLIWAGITREGHKTVRCNGFSRIALVPLTSGYGGEDIIQELKSTGLATRTVQDEVRAEWEKALWNIGVNALCAVTRAKRNGVVIESPYLLELLRGIIIEAEAIASKVGVQMDSFESIVDLTKATAGNTNSMVVDLMALKATEIEFLNGYIVKLGASLNVATPFNLFAYNLVKFAETQSGVALTS